MPNIPNTNVRGQILTSVGNGQNSSVWSGSVGAGGEMAQSLYAPGVPGSTAYGGYTLYGGGYFPAQSLDVGSVTSVGGIPIVFAGLYEYLNLSSLATYLNVDTTLAARTINVIAIVAQIGGANSLENERTFGIPQAGPGQSGTFVGYSGTVTTVGAALSITGGWSVTSASLLNCIATVIWNSN